MKFNKANLRHLSGENFSNSYSSEFRKPKQKRASTIEEMISGKRKLFYA